MPRRGKRRAVTGRRAAQGRAKRSRKQPPTVAEALVAMTGILTEIKDGIGVLTEIKDGIGVLVEAEEAKSEAERAARAVAQEKKRYKVANEGFSAEDVQRWFEENNLPEAAIFAGVDGKTLTCSPPEWFLNKSPSAGRLIFNTWHKGKDGAQLDAYGMLWFHKDSSYTFPVRNGEALIALCQAFDAAMPASWGERHERYLRRHNPPLPDQMNAYVAMGQTPAEGLVLRLRYYKDLVEVVHKKLEEAKRVPTIVGTPGTGKTMARNFIGVDRLYRDDKALLVFDGSTHVSSGTTLMKIVGGKVHAAFCRDARRAQDAVRAHTGPIYRLLDVADGKFGGTLGLVHSTRSMRTIVTTSPNTALRKWMKSTGKRAAVPVLLHVPSSTPEEMQHLEWRLHKADYVKEFGKQAARAAMKRHVGEVGGKVGWILRRLLDCHTQDDMAVYLAMLTQEAQRVVESQTSGQLRPLPINIVSGAVTADMLVIRSSTYDVDGATNKFAPNEVTWASPWVASVVGKHVAARAGEVLKNIDTMRATSGVRGHLAEGLMLGTFLRGTNGGRLNDGVRTFASVLPQQDAQHNRREARNPKWPKTDDTLTEALRRGPSEVVHLHRDEHAAALAAALAKLDGDGAGKPVLLLPVSFQHPGVDALFLTEDVEGDGVKRRLYALQATLADTHPLSAGGKSEVAKWQGLCRARGIEFNTFLYLLPPRQYPHYVKQRGFDRLDIRQAIWTLTERKGGEHNNQGADDNQAAQGGEQAQAGNED